MEAHVHTHTQTQKYKHKHKHKAPSTKHQHKHQHKHRHKYKHQHKRKHKHKHKHKHTHKRTHTHARTHAHTHTKKRERESEKQKQKLYPGKPPLGPREPQSPTTRHCRNRLPLMLRRSKRNLRKLEKKSGKEHRTTYVKLSRSLRSKRRPGKTYGRLKNLGTRNSNADEIPAESK